jgi:GWxTD domain-containing protein
MLSLLLFLISTAAFSNKMSAWLDYATFYSPAQGPYIETYITLDASTLVLRPLPQGGFSGEVEITIIFKQGDIVQAIKKSQLQSPIQSDTLSKKTYFMDIQRFPLDTGLYEMHIIIKDTRLADSKGIQVTEKVEIQFPSETISISTLQLVESYVQAAPESKISKSGYDIIPNTSAFYPENSNSLRFYCEIYNSHKHLGKDEPFLVSFFIESFETARVQPGFVRHKRETTKEVLVLFADFNISTLGNGNYNLAVEIRNKENLLLSTQRVFFQRFNPSVSLKIEDFAQVNTENTFASYILNTDTLKAYLKCLYPISTEMEKSFAFSQINANNLELMQKFFYQFWYSRNATDPQSEWNRYYEEVKKVDQLFRTPIKRGHETDRGRVYLQYGAPNTMADSRNEPTSYPYEIWHYYRTNNNQTNKRFVFYLPDLVTNDYVLLHSDAIGEVQDNAWQIRLNRRNTGYESIDDTQPMRHYGSRAQDLYNNPR